MSPLGVLGRHVNKPINAFIKKGNDESVASAIPNCEERSKKQSFVRRTRGRLFPISGLLLCELVTN
jgi:hypothetical protein